MREMAYLVLIVDPKLLMPLGNFPERAGEIADAIRGARPTDPNKPVRMPFDRSAQKRRQAERDDKLEVPDEVHKKLIEMTKN
jgi:LDH2 family malate/lactate/ureidoglycolate dehydrogenase